MESLAQDPWLRSILELSARTKDLCTQTAELLAVDARGESSAEAAQKQAKLIKTVRAQLSQIRGAHREVALSSRRTKQVTADAKVEVDKLHLSLSNLSYEERHLREEIMNCESYDHSYQSLPLIPVDEFISLSPDHQHMSEHDLTIARINHEHATREALEQQRQALLKQKQALIAENKRRKENLASLDKDLEKFIDAAKPIQQLLEKEDQSQPT